MTLSSNISSSSKILNFRTIYVFLALGFTVLLFRHYEKTFPSHYGDPIHRTAMPRTHISLVEDLRQYFADYPVQPPYKEVFGELGQRVRILRDWMGEAEETADTHTKASLNRAIEHVAALQFPFLQNASKSEEHSTPVADLRASFQPASAGIVIPCGEKTARFAAHLITSLRSVLGSTLPIQLVYAGDEDLKPGTRDRLAGVAESGPPIEFLDVTTVFDDATLQLRSGGWAIKPFAVLGSKFERVILMDADSVFLQKPEILLSHGAFLRTGALLFHDRLVWKHAYAERHEWFRNQIRRPSAAMNLSLVWTEDFAEEADSGVVVVDKTRIDVLAGLLHICWQNTKAVRDEATYKMMYGDKESWWLGFELSGASYEFEKHYGAIIGWEQEDAKGRTKICSFVIAHVDEKDRLLWYNGSLLKNKKQPDASNIFAVPDSWMVDAQWEKGADRLAMSCMVGGEIRAVMEQETKILTETIERAKIVDGIMQI